MALREIRLYPDPVLTTKAKPVDAVDDEIKTLVDDMVQTMYDAPGIGLAAPQIGVSLRVAVIDVTVPPGEDEEGDEADDDEAAPAAADEPWEPDLRVLINPRIVERDGEITWNEGCLSMPGLYRELKRAGHVVVEALDRDGNLVRHEADGLLAVCMQHEIDHLDGVMFTDRLSRMRKKMALREWKKLKAAIDDKKTKNEAGDDA